MRINFPAVLLSTLFLAACNEERRPLTATPSLPAQAVTYNIPQPTTPLTYRLSSGNETRRVMPSDFDSRGRLIRYSLRCMTYTAANGAPSHDGSLPDGPLQVGTRWEHTYRVTVSAPCMNPESYTRSRACEARAQDRIEFAGRQIEVIRVECQNRRLDRTLPQQEYLTFTTEGNLLLIETIRWGGTTPGGGEWRLVPQT